MSQARKASRTESQSTPSAAQYSLLEDEEFGGSSDIAHSSAIENSDAIVQGRVLPKTRKQYYNLLKIVAAYFKESVPQALNPEGNIIVPVHLDYLKCFLSHITADREDGTVYSHSYLTAYLSALKFLYTEASQQMSKAASDYLSLFSDGYKRKIAVLKEQGVMKNREGKLPFTFQIFMNLCQISPFAAETRAPTSSFVHCFTILCWNLFARSISVSDLRTHHLS